jgi:protein phosphatase 1G
MQGWRKRMEDSHISDLNVSDGVHVFGVFDGHGGREVAVWVKKHFTKELASLKTFKSGNLQAALPENFLRLDQIMVEPNNKNELKAENKKSKEDDERISRGQESNEKSRQIEIFKQMMDPKGHEDCDIAMFTGCTACVVAIDEINEKIICANSGDSRAILCKKGIAYALSNDHKPDLDSEKARIYKADGWVSEGRVKGNLNLSRSLGDLEYKQNKKVSQEDQMITANPEVITDKFTSDCDFLVIACDGVWDCKTNQEVADFVYKRFKNNPTIKLSKIIEELLDECLATDIYNRKLFVNLIETGVGCDNMTCVIVNFKKNKK